MLLFLLTILSIILGGTCLLACIGALAQKAPKERDTATEMAIRPLLPRKRKMSPNEASALLWMLLLSLLLFTWPIAAYNAPKDTPELVQTTCNTDYGKILCWVRPEELSHLPKAQNKE